MAVEKPSREKKRQRDMTTRRTRSAMIKALQTGRQCNMFVAYVFQSPRSGRLHGAVHVPVGMAPPDINEFVRQYAKDGDADKKPKEVGRLDDMRIQISSPVNRDEATRGRGMVDSMGETRTDAHDGACSASMKHDRTMERIMDSDDSARVTPSNEAAKRFLVKFGQILQREMVDPEEQGGANGIGMNPAEGLLHTTQPKLGQVRRA